MATMATTTHIAGLGSPLSLARRSSKPSLTSGTSSTTSLGVYLARFYFCFQLQLFQIKNLTNRQIRTSKYYKHDFKSEISLDSNSVVEKTVAKILT